MFPLVAPPVVGGALVGVAEHVVGGVDFLEAGFGVAVAAGHVGVILAGQFAVRGTNVLVGGIAIDAEDLIEVLSHAGVFLSNADDIIADGKWV